MRIKDSYLALFSLGLLFYLSVIQRVLLLDSFIISLQVYLFLRFVNNIGFTICYFDFLCFYSVMDTLLMPLIGYRYFTTDIALVWAWGWYMRVDEATYFSYLIPANLALFAGVNLLIRKFTVQHYKEMIAQVKVHARGKGKVGVVLTIIGFISSFFINQPSSIAFVIYLCSMLKYIGPFYIYFSDAPFRKQIFLVSIAVFLVQATVKGMFGEFTMYVTLAMLIVSLRFRLRFFSKLAFILVGFAFVFVLQSVKGVYRHITWRGTQTEGLSLDNSSHVEILGNLFMDRITNPEKLLSQQVMFAVYVRMNQGYLISRAMDYVPRVEPFAQGETILRSLGAIAVPRVLWPNKPESGGRENLSRFLGIKRKLSYSMNIGPYGEAYGNFGPTYGVIFIFFYGLLLSYLFRAFLLRSIRRPTLLIWAPFLFYITLTVETDILSTVNFFVKGSLFIVALFWISKKFFKVSL